VIGRWAFPLAAVLASLALAGGGCSRKPSPEQIRAWDGELARLQAEQDSLRARSAELIAKDPRILGLPPGDVVVAVPTDFVRSVIGILFRDVANRVTLSLKGIKAHAAKKIKKVVTIGEFVVDVDITEVLGKLEPGEPDITFGGDSISLSLPVRVAEGHGEALIHFVWNGKNIADLTCGDLDITQKVTGNVIPADYTISGSMVLQKQGRRVISSPHFPETRLRLRVKPSKESWDAIHAILEEKKGVCGWVLDKVNVPKILTNLTEEKGFNVKLPLNKIKPVVIPAGIRDSVTVGGRTLAIAAQTNTIRIDPDAFWYSATVRVEKGEP
jgi:hypothetical protein